jgi:ferritin-like metal-binding protein YciE
MGDQIKLEHYDLTQFFIHHLNKIFSAKSHLLNRLPEILYEAHFADLEEGIFETIRVVEHQRDRMKAVYELMDATMDDGAFNGLLGLIDDSFADIKANSENDELRDMSILFYLSNIEGMEMASFQVLQLMAVKLGNEDVKRLIRENYEEAQADKTLLLLITTKYLATV